MKNLLPGDKVTYRGGAFASEINKKDQKPTVGSVVSHIHGTHQVVVEFGSESYRMAPGRLKPAH